MASGDAANGQGDKGEPRGRAGVSDGDKREWQMKQKSLLLYVNTLSYYGERI